MEDQSQGHLYLCNKPFKWVTSMLYPGYKVTAHKEFCVPDIGPKLAAQQLKHSSAQS